MRISRKLLPQPSERMYWTSQPANKFDFYKDTYLTDRYGVEPRHDLFDRDAKFIHCPGVFFSGHGIEFQMPRMLRSETPLDLKFPKFKNAKVDVSEKIFTYQGLSSVAFNKPSGNLTVKIERVPMSDSTKGMFGLCVGLGPASDFLTHTNKSYLEGVYLLHFSDRYKDGITCGESLGFKTKSGNIENFSGGEGLDRPKLPWKGVTIKIRRDGDIIRILVNDKEYLKATHNPTNEEQRNVRLYPMIHTMDTGYELRYLDPLDEK
jgi:hypothetical protein